MVDILHTSAGIRLHAGRKWRPLGIIQLLNSNSWMAVAVTLKETSSFGTLDPKSSEYVRCVHLKSNLDLSASELERDRF